MVNFNDADTESQTYALSAFQTIKEHWQRKEQTDQWIKLPVIHIKREFQVTMQNFAQIQDLCREGVIENRNWLIATSQGCCFSIHLNYKYTPVENNDWLIQDTEGRWMGISDGYHRVLMKYNKIVKE